MSKKNKSTCFLIFNLFSNCFRHSLFAVIRRLSRLLRRKRPLAWCILIAPGLGLLEAPHILGGLLTSSSSERRTPSPCDRYFWGCFSPQSATVLCLFSSVSFLTFLTFRPNDSMLQSNVIAGQMPRRGLNSTIHIFLGVNLLAVNGSGGNS